VKSLSEAPVPIRFVIVVSGPKQKSRRPGLSRPWDRVVT